MTKTKSQSFPALMSQAQTYERAGRLADAQEIYRNVIAADPDFHPAYHALGLLALGSGNLALASDLLKAAIALNKKEPLYRRNHGELCRRLGRLDEAIAAGRQACRLAPTDIDAHYNLGLAYSDAKDYDRAIQAYRQALKLNPDHGRSWNNLGSALELRGDEAAALGAYARAVALNPQHAEAQNNLGALYSAQGKPDEARACFQAAIDAKPDFVEAHHNLSSLKTYTRNDPHRAMLERLYADRSKLSEPARIRYCFALGKARDDCGEYDRAFAAYEEGNRLQHALSPMDECRADALSERIMQVFDRDFFAARKDWRGGDQTPIFIVGMPRSGTTLLEQILCSHASVYGAGELPYFNEAVKTITGAHASRPFTEGVAGLTEADMRRLGGEYAKRVWRLSPESRYITDKMPANFFLIGLIHLALPDAKIIHAMRDPMDSCFSCYSRLFNDTMEFACDQGTLGRYYVRYVKLMRHWRRVLPQDRILDLRYEDMVTETEALARRVLEFVGLPWDENCLDFHRNERTVKTASMVQVRKPIYRTSVARWKHFAKHLQPLLEIVKDYRPTDDVPETPETAPPLVGEGAGANRADVFHIRGIELYKQERLDEALANYEQALALKPDFPPALNSMGFVLQDLGRTEEALACFEKAVRLAPEFAMARLNLGMAQLKSGDWTHGWENYEARWTGSAESAGGTFQRPPCPLPQWEGQAATGRQALLVITEQGFGDAFQFSRYLRLAAQRFAKVGFVCSTPTLRLMEWSFGDKVVMLNRLPADYATWHWQCPLMSLPRAFQTRLDGVPAATPYLTTPRVAKDHWRARLEEAAPGRFRVGIAWAGRRTHQYDARRSLGFEQLLPLLHDPRITWVSLQKWAVEESRPAIPPDIDWLDWTDELADFADTAALASNLDLVISIDSAMVHLAGALARPVWMMNRFDSEWRWLGRREDSPWYPGLRIFNQPRFGDWASVLQAVRAALQSSSMPRDAAKPHRAAAADMNAPETAPAPPEPSPDQAMQLAIRHQSAGRLQEAEQVLRRTLEILPDHAHALHLQGVIAHQTGHAARAIELIARAIAIRSDVALFHGNLAEMYRRQERLDEAIRHGERAVELDPSMACAHANLGIALYDAKDYDAAEIRHQKALALSPAMPQSLNNMGSIRRARKDLPGAVAWYRRALAVAPDFLESLSNLGAVLVEDERADEAVPVLEKALHIQPAYPEALCNLGLARLTQERIEPAIMLLQRALQLKPDYPEALVGLARALHEQNRLPEAAALLRRAVEKAPQNKEAWCRSGTVFVELEEAKQAEASYRKALEIDPEMSDALAGLGNLRLEEGKIDEAQALLARAIFFEPANVGARYHLIQTQKIKPGDDNLAALEAMASSADTLSDDRRIPLHYALGKAYDDLEEYRKSFPHFIEGARLKRAKLHYDPACDAARARRIIETFDRDFFERLRGVGNPSDVPVFVLGMPRSGTTLTEQIIASHPAVHGAGELHDLMEVARSSIPGQPPRYYPDNLADLTPQAVAVRGREYLARLRARAPDARRITDKMPANYQALGLISLMLPNAKIIHVKRNPVDTCISCFTRLFNRHQEATYDLAELGRHYLNYAHLMQHWRQVLPQDSFIEVQYENIVADTEGQARRLIEYCGLEWDNACLDFHKNKRSIRTASVTQVRRPIYTDSVGRRRHYEEFLAPLLEALGDCAS